MSDGGRPIPVVYGTARVAGDLAPVPSALDVEIDRWFHEVSANRGWDRALYDYLSSRRDELKARLAKLGEELSHG